MRSPVRRIVITAATVGVCLGFVPMASADVPVTQGWWSATTLGPLAAPAPDVPDDGMLVQGPADSPSAYAALAFEVPDGETADQVLLRAAPDSASTGAELRLCPLVSAQFEPAQGGPISDAPEFDCTQEITAAPDEFSGTYTFDVSALPGASTLAVAVLPTGPVDRVVLSAADAMTLTTSRPTPDTPVNTPAPTTDPGTSTPSPDGGVASPSAPDRFDPPPTPPTPAPVTEPIDGEVAAPVPAPLTPPAAPAFASATIPEDANPLLAGLVLLGGAAAATFWWLSGRERPDEIDPSAEGVPA